MIAALVCFLLLVYLMVNILQIAIRNYKAHQFFKLKTPDLPVAPNPNIFSGHLFRIGRAKHNWRILTELHKKYGPTFGFYVADQPWVATKDIDLLKLIEIDQGHKHVNRIHYGIPFRDFNNSFFQTDDEDWRRVRRVVTPPLTNRKVKSDEVSSDIESIVDQLTDSLKRKISRSLEETGERSFILDVDDIFRRYTLSIIFAITFKQHNIVDFDAEVDEWTDVMQEGLRDSTNPLIFLSIMLPFLRPIIEFLAQYTKIGGFQVKLVQYIHKAADQNRLARAAYQKVQQKLGLESGQKVRSFSELESSGTFKRRLVDYIIDAFLEKKMTHDEFIGSTLFLLLAGFSTTADELTHLVWQLALHPEIQEKLRQSIHEEGIDSDYVQWCIYETIRFHPAVPLGVGRVLATDVNMNGVFLPKGSFVTPSIHSIHHDSSIWPEADEFKPERWRDSASFHAAAFVGFGLGPRNCIGSKLAIQEMKLVMESILVNFRIEKCEETTEEYKFTTPALLFTNLEQPIKVRLVALT